MKGPTRTRRRGDLSPTRREIARRARLFNQLVAQATSVRIPIASGTVLVKKADDAPSIEAALVTVLEALSQPSEPLGASA